MDWRRVYVELIDSARQKNRSKNDVDVYERHHIIPEFMFKHRKRKGPSGHVLGNANSKTNMVLLTPREHILAHVILARIYRGTHYEYGCIGALMIMLGDNARTKRGLHRSMIVESVKKTKYYQKLKSEYSARMAGNMKGKIIVKDAETGQMMGKVDVSHPHVLSGKWVHHSKGKAWTQERRNNSPDSSGTNNPRHSGVSDAEYITGYLHMVSLIGRPIPLGLWKLTGKNFGVPTLSGAPAIRAGMFKKMISDAEHVTGITYQHEDWFKANRKGTALYHATKEKLCQSK